MTSLSTQLLVIGGGATGLGIAWDAALRGIKVVLVEQYDLGQGTSGRYHGLLHSGGRYTTSDPQSASECAAENEILRRIVPHAIENTGGLFVSTPADPLDYPDRWFQACKDLGVTASEIDLSELQSREPLLNPRISRAFEVRDAALDSFDLAHALNEHIALAGGKVMLRHQLTDLIMEGDRVSGGSIKNLVTGDEFRLDAELTINASGPWARRTANLADLDIPISLGKGTMIAMASRMVNTVINRLQPPSDGDIVVPVGTVCVLGTTDIPVESPENLTIEPWEIDLLIAEGDFIIPGLQSARPLRAWAGIRPLYSPDLSIEGTRALHRAHALLDHKEIDGVEGIVSIIGGKLTTFRLMAQETVDLACNKLELEVESETANTPLSKQTNGSFYTLTERLNRFSQEPVKANDKSMICECELVTQEQLVQAIESEGAASLDDLRRDLRLGMGPCQGAYCAYRTAGIAADFSPSIASSDFLQAFLDERWKGLKPLAWGRTLRQMDFLRRIYLELLGSKVERDRS